MKHPLESNQESTLTAWGAVGVGLVIVIVGVVLDPIGSDPDSGLLKLGATGTRWLLGAFGVFFLLVGLWAFISRRSRSPK